MLQRSRPPSDCFTIAALTDFQGIPMADYVSEHTLFINAYLEKNPEQAQEQKKGQIGRAHV